MAQNLLVRAIPALLVLLSGCSPPEPLPVDDRAGMGRFGTVIPATTSVVVPPETTGALEEVSTTAPATTTSTPTTPSAVPSSTSNGQPTPSTTGSPDRSFTVARATGEWLGLDEQDDWLLVDLPIRPNGTMGWVRRSDVTLTTHSAMILVDLSEMRLWAWEDGALVADGAIALGTDETPTPPGDYFVNEIQEQDDPDTLFGSWIIGTSGFSEVLGLVDGGDPAVAIHGTNDPSVLGTEVSLGCVRVHDDVVGRLARLPLGTPVEVRA